MNKISTKELFTVVISLLTLCFPTLGTQLILNTGNTSSLLILIIGYIISIIPFFIIIKISNKLTNQNIFQYNIEKFKIIGHIINTIYTILLLYLAFMLAWTTLNFTINQLLIRNSYYIIAFIYSCILAFAVCKGKEIICRTSLVLYFILIFSFIIGFSLLIPEIDIENILPIISVSKSKIISIALTIPSYFILPLTAILCIKRNDISDKHKLTKSLIIAYITGAIIIFIFYFFIISIYGIDLASIFIYPEYVLFKKINLFNFIQRVENIMSTSFFISSFSGICFIVYFIKTYIKDTLKIKNKNKINITTFILTIAIAFTSIYLFTNYKIQILILKFPYIFSLIFPVLIINFILIKIKRDKN